MDNETHSLPPEIYFCALTFSVIWDDVTLSIQFPEYWKDVLVSVS